MVATAVVNEDVHFRRMCSSTACGRRYCSLVDDGHGSMHYHMMLGVQTKRGRQPFHTVVTLVIMISSKWHL